MKAWKVSSIGWLFASIGSFLKVAFDTNPSTLHWSQIVLFFGLGIVAAELMIGDNDK